MPNELSTHLDEAKWSYRGDGYDSYRHLIRLLMECECFTCYDVKPDSITSFKEFRDHILSHSEEQVSDYQKGFYRPYLSKNLIIAVLDKLYLYFRDYNAVDGRKEQRQIDFVDQLGLPLTLVESLSDDWIRHSRLYKLARKRRAKEKKPDA